jgi:hypothetical protein
VARRTGRRTWGRWAVRAVCLIARGRTDNDTIKPRAPPLGEAARADRCARRWLRCPSAVASEP